MMMSEEVVDKKGTFLMLESDRYSFVQRVCTVLNLGTRPIYAGSTFLLLK